jgi:hypothetical protein
MTPEEEEKRREEKRKLDELTEIINDFCWKPDGLQYQPNSAREPAGSK